MRQQSRISCQYVAAVLILLLTSAGSISAADKQQRKAKEAEAKRLMGLGKAAEKQGHLIDARTQYLAAEHVLYTEDAEKALQRVAEAADQQVRSLMDRAAQAYAAEQFASAAQLLESAGDLHPGSLAIGCNLGLTRYQQGNRDEALALLNECVGAMRDKDTRRQMGELATALGTGDRLSVVSPAARQQVARLNDAILHDVGDDRESRDEVALPMTTVCGQMKQLQAGHPRNPALLFNLAKCAESDGRLDDATVLLTQYVQAAPGAIDLDEVQARLVLLKALSELPEPKGTVVRAAYTSASKHVDAREYDRAIADYQQADEAMPEFRETKRRMASLLEAQGQIDRAREYWRQVLTAENGPDGAQQTETLLAGLDAEKGQYDEHISDSRKILHDLLARSVLEGEPIGRIYAAYRLQLANTQLQSADVLWPLAPEANLLQAFTCSQMNDFSCVRASFDAQRSLALPVSFYGAVFYKGVDPKKRDEAERAYGKFEFENGVVRFAELSTVKPKKRKATVTPGGADDLLGRLGQADGLRHVGFQGFTVPATAVKHLETSGGILYLEVDDKHVKHRKMFIEPLSFVLDVPPQGPGARRYMNNYINIAETYGGVEKAKLGKESSTTGEKLKMVYSIASIGMNVASVMFGDFSSAISVATGVNGLAHTIGLSQRQVKRLTIERQQVVRGVAFKAIPSEPVSLAFRKDLK
jgi:tetratricopeptide (TPR) repeat protein